MEGVVNLFVGTQGIAEREYESRIIDEKSDDATFV